MSEPDTKEFWTQRRAPRGIHLDAVRAGAQPERGAGSPFPPLDPKYPDLPMQKWYAPMHERGHPALARPLDRRKSR